MPRPPSSPLFPYTTLFRSVLALEGRVRDLEGVEDAHVDLLPEVGQSAGDADEAHLALIAQLEDLVEAVFVDRKSTRLNSSHSQISYAVFCLKKKSEYFRQS